jgi:nicotinamidase-related amidase
MASIVTRRQLPIPPHFDEKTVGQLRMIPYQQLATSAAQWAKLHKIKPAVKDKLKICLMPIDTQITFCFENGELPVLGALADCNRLAKFIYQNLDYITEMTPTFDTHLPFAIFHSFFWVDEKGQNPAPLTTIKSKDVENGTWRVNPAIAYTLRNDYVALQAHGLHYVRSLEKAGKEALLIWPFHSMLGGVGHALVPTVEEAIFFHSIARAMNMDPQIKGGNCLTENYSIFGAEVRIKADGTPLAQKNVKLFEKLIGFDAIIIAGQAKSHCVAWTIEDLLNDIASKDPKMAKKVYLLEDCTSPVKAPNPNYDPNDSSKGPENFVDFTAKADAAFEKFAAAGMNVVKSTTPIWQWPGLESLAA